MIIGEEKLGGFYHIIAHNMPESMIEVTWIPIWARGRISIKRENDIFDLLSLRDGCEHIIVLISNNSGDNLIREIIVIIGSVRCKDVCKILQNMRFYVSSLSEHIITFLKQTDIALGLSNFGSAMEESSIPIPL